MPLVFGLLPVGDGDDPDDPDGDAGEIGGPADEPPAPADPDATTPGGIIADPDPWDDGCLSDADVAFIEGAIRAPRYAPGDPAEWRMRTPERPDESEPLDLD